METINQLLLAFLLNAAWQIALVVMIAHLCQKFLNNTSARIQHWLWVITLILCFGVPVFTSFNISDDIFFRAQTVHVLPVNISDFQTSSSSDSEKLSLEIPQKETASFISISRAFTLVLFALYLLFIIYRLVKLLRTWRRTQIIGKKILSIAPSENVLTILEECQIALNVGKAQISYSSEISSPITMGVFNPVIILPEQFVKETGRDILLSAIGHELVHIKRRDYLLNLLYEFIYLPLSFHPASVLVKRRIRETRELRCDELVADMVLSPAVYARSLVQIAGSAINFGHHSTMTIGINDADILEKRIMKILERPKITVPQRNLLLLAASILFIAAFAAAFSFTIRPVIAQQSEAKSREEKLKAEQDAVIKEKESMEAKRAAEMKMIQEGKKKFSLKIIPSTESALEKLDREKNELEMMNRLVKTAKVSMSQAIEIATKEFPGAFLECRLIFYNPKDPNDRDAGTPTYLIRIAGEQEVKHLLVNAIDGTVSSPLIKK